MLGWGETGPIRAKISITTSVTFPKQQINRNPTPSFESKPWPGRSDTQNFPMIIYLTFMENVTGRKITNLSVMYLFFDAVLTVCVMKRWVTMRQNDH
jgi:hypothetical protein